MRKKHNVVLKQRDLRLFQLLLEGKVLTKEQINRYIFKNVSDQCISARLKKLGDFGVIARGTFINEWKSKYYYALTPKGLSHIQGLLINKITRKAIKSDSISHDLDLVDIRFALEQMETVKSYFTENILQSCDEFTRSSQFSPFVKLNSDAVADVQTPHGRVVLAIEYDATSKSSARYSKKLRAYYERHQIEGVLYIARNKCILESLKNVEKKVLQDVREESKVYYTLLENVMVPSGEITFQTVDGYTFVLS